MITNKENDLDKEIKKILSFSELSGKLKDELRHQWTVSGRQESVAEHSWRLAVLVSLCAPYLDKKIDREKAVLMALFHDIVEAEAGDQFFLTNDENLVKQQSLKENKAIANIRTLLNNEQGNQIHSQWHEFENNSSYEAKVVRALDKIEGYIQQNEADIDTWTEAETLSVFYYMDKYCDFDSFLKKLKNQVQIVSINKISSSDLDIPKLIEELKGKGICLSESFKKKLEGNYEKV